MRLEYDHTEAGFNLGNEIVTTVAHSYKCDKSGDEEMAAFSPTTTTDHVQRW